MTNNEFMKWFVKGFIAKSKGISINWVAIIVITTIKKSSKELEKVMSNTRNCSKRNGDAIEVGIVVDGAWRVEGQMRTSHCLYGVPTTKLSKVQEVYVFLSEILIKSTKKVEYLEREKLNIEEKITRMHFHMHVLKTITQEE